MKKFIVSFLVIISVFTLMSVVSANDVESVEGNKSVPPLENPLGDVNLTPQQLIGRIINSVLGVVGSLALLMFVYGGIVWMTSSGSAEKVKQGRDIIVWSAIGLVIVFSAYSLTRVLIEGIAPAL